MRFRKLVVTSFLPVIGSLIMLGSLIFMGVPWPYFTLLTGYLFWTGADQQRTRMKS